MDHVVADAVQQANPDADTAPLVDRYGAIVPVCNFDGRPNRLAKMDALDAFLQMLGTLVDFASFDSAEAAR